MRINKVKFYNTPYDLEESKTSSLPSDIKGNTLTVNVRKQEVEVGDEISISIPDKGVLEYWYIIIGIIVGLGTITYWLYSKFSSS